MLLDRDQVDRHGEDNTRRNRQATIRYQRSLRRIALLSGFCTTPAVFLYLKLVRINLYAD